MSRAKNLTQKLESPDKAHRFLKQGMEEVDDGQSTIELALDDVDKVGVYDTKKARKLLDEFDTARGKLFSELSKASKRLKGATTK